MLITLIALDGTNIHLIQKVFSISFLAHASDIDDLLEGLDSVLKDWLDRLHDTKSSLHIVNLRLHALNGLHLSGNLNEGLSIIESLKDSSSKGLLDVLDSSGLGNGGIRVTSSLGSEGRREGGLERNKELILVHGLNSGLSVDVLVVVVMVVVSGGGSSNSESEFHRNLL